MSLFILFFFSSNVLNVWQASTSFFSIDYSCIYYFQILSYFSYVSFILISMLRLNGSFFRVFFYCLSPFLCRFYDLSPLVRFVNIFLYSYLLRIYHFTFYKNLLFFFLLTCDYFNYLSLFIMFSQHVYLPFRCLTYHTFFLFLKSRRTVK